MKAKTIVHVVTNVSHYQNSNERTGLWLSELSHAWEVFAAEGFTQIIVSPKGGEVPLEPRSLKWPNLDASGRKWLMDESKTTLLQNTLAPDVIDPALVEAIYFTGGHAVMFDFSDSVPLQRLTREVWEAGHVVASVCHGFCGLLNITLADGSFLIAGRKMTGFSWTEEKLAGVTKKVPYNAEEVAKQRGALYDKALLLFTSNVVVDGRLVTGQNPQSAKATAQMVLRALQVETKAAR
ncbi:hypothetical protein V866_007891 [Kwoniella sp. B9012]